MAGAQSVAVPLILPTGPVLELCEAYDQDLGAFERIMRLEAALYPIVLERWEANRDSGGGSPWGEED